MRTPKKYATGFLLILITGITSGGCSTVRTTAGLDFCQNYQIVHTLHCGTEAQKLAVDQNNAVYLEKCQ